MFGSLKYYTYISINFKTKKMAKKKMKCGSCGNDKHVLYIKDNGNVIVKCTQCENQSVIKPRPAELTINNHKGDGCICVFPKK